MNAAKTLMAFALAGLASTAGAAEIWNHSPLPLSGQSIWNGFSDGSTTVDVKKSDSPAVSYAGSGGQFSGLFYTDGTANADEFFRFFCIDLFQYASTGPSSYTESLPTTHWPGCTTLPIPTSRAKTSTTLDKRTSAHSVRKCAVVGIPAFSVGDHLRNQRHV